MPECQFTVSLMSISLTDKGGHESELQSIPQQMVTLIHCRIVLLQLVETVLEILCWHRGEKNLLISLQGNHAVGLLEGK